MITRFDVRISRFGMYPYLREIISRFCVRISRFVAGFGIDGVVPSPDMLPARPMSFLTFHTCQDMVDEPISWSRKISHDGNKIIMIIPLRLREVLGIRAGMLMEMKSMGDWFGMRISHLQERPPRGRDKNVWYRKTRWFGCSVALTIPLRLAVDFKIKPGTPVIMVKRDGWFATRADPAYKAQQSETPANSPSNRPGSASAEEEQSGGNPNLTA